MPFSSVSVRSTPVAYSKRLLNRAVQSCKLCISGLWITMFVWRSFLTIEYSTVIGELATCEAARRNVIFFVSL